MFIYICCSEIGDVPLKKDKMVRNTVILVRNDKMKILEVYGGLKKACDDFELPYHTLSRKKLPFEWKDWSFSKKEIIK